ncbi:PHB depolymerase family esterase [Variovorax sp. J22G21]|nr:MULTISPECIES: PHB depolymerase family esterase [unclassified Variovorax]MDM0037661.1 PHB depolymerase family esterase [Variovorax sp. J22R193]MDM0062437.1 PHB depolymerase family esterase [Variovorax sp. J22G21]
MGGAAGFCTYFSARPELTTARFVANRQCLHAKLVPLPSSVFSWLQVASEVGASFFAPPSQGAGATVPSTQSGQRHDDHGLYVPTSAPLRGAPLVVMLHGAGQDPDDFAVGTRMNAAAERHGFIVLYPAQSAQANMQRCWNWFEQAHQMRGQGEPARIADLTLRIVREHQVNPDRVYVAGLSAGGAMAALLGELYPDVYAAVGVHSGLAARAGSNLSSALAAMRGTVVRADTAASGMPTIVFHGDKDATVNPVNGRHVIEASLGLDCPYVSGESTGPDGRRATCRTHSRDGSGVCGKHWTLHDAQHAWSGGSSEGSFADPFGPDASEEMLQFFSGQRRSVRRTENPS